LEPKAKAPEEVMAPEEIVPMLVKLPEVSILVVPPVWMPVTVEFIAPAAAKVPVKLALEEIVWPLIKPEVIVLEPKAKAPEEVMAPEEIVPMLVKLPEASIL
jgi:hypothetical protein